MSDQINDTETADESIDQEAPDTALAATETDSTDTTEDQDTENPSRREAAYRVKLRETESYRDQLLEQLNAMRQAEIERIAGESIANPVALWSNGATVDSLLADDGTVDPAAVRAAADDAANTLGLQPARRPGVVPTEGRVMNEAWRHKGNGWSDAFTPA
ncbi:hypothetical protein [Gordonia zhaorongruii]|uniref:hypothetical protein n=1 Tax=Gordonia zhaorongruii TaxID=2597659 RepID=UPI001180490C|nr:hypothetical protein [Gordonia zhaorongruii]